MSFDENMQEAIRARLRSAPGLVYTPGGRIPTKDCMNVVLISTYELGHQPFGLASPAAWLQAAGARVTCLDLAVQSFAPDLVEDAGLVAFYVPMHTATRLAGPVIEQVCALNPAAHVCCYGLYAPVNEPFLRGLGVQTILGGEFESGLVSLYRRLARVGEGRRTKDERFELSNGEPSSLVL